MFWVFVSLESSQEGSGNQEDRKYRHHVCVYNILPNLKEYVLSVKKTRSSLSTIVNSVYIYGEYI